MLWHRKKTDKEIAEESNREMARYDQLGPMARIAIANAHRILDIGKIISSFKTSRQPSEWDEKIDGYPELVLTDPATDARLAAKIDSIVRDDCHKSIEDLTLRPRRLIQNARRYR